MTPFPFYIESYSLEFETDLFRELKKILYVNEIKGF